MQCNPLDQSGSNEAWFLLFTAFPFSAPSDRVPQALSTVCPTSPQQQAIEVTGLFCRGVHASARQVLRLKEQAPSRWASCAY